MCTTSRHCPNFAKRMLLIQLKTLFLFVQTAMQCCTSIKVSPCL
jgi:hypothetical protein